MGRLLCLAGLLIGLLASAAPAQGEEPFFDKIFGATDGSEPGFRVRFDRRGAVIRTVELLDEKAQPGGETPYLLTLEEQVGSNGAWRGWFSLRERVPGELFPEAGGLDVAEWTVAAGTTDTVTFLSPASNGVQVEKTFSYSRGTRHLDLEIALIAAADATPSSRPWSFVMRGIGLLAEESQFLIGNPGKAAGAGYNADDELTWKFVRAGGEPQLEEPMLAQVTPGRAIEAAGVTNRFFAAILYPQNDVARAAWQRADAVAWPGLPQYGMEPWTATFVTHSLLFSAPAPGSESRAAFRLFIGPKSFRTIEQSEGEYAAFEPVVEDDLDPPGCFCPLPGTRTMAILLTSFLSFLQEFVGSWGFAIVLMTILIRGVMLPLNFRMQKSMRAYGAKMAKLKPKIDDLQKRHANNPQQLRLEMAQLQREHKLIPPVGGCLPMFITIPVFIGLFSALRTSYELRHQSFLWANDLSAPDALIDGVPLLGALNLLPLIYMVVVAYQMWTQPLPTDPQQRQVQQMMRFLPMVFGVLLYSYAAGMLLYMVTSATFALIESRITRKILGPVNPDAGGLGAAPMM